ncbi:hypothetical protein ACB092_05G217600 [Castanea dentata]
MAREPYNLVTDILCRLPFKSLQHFKCLSKDICAIINSPKFKTMQRNHSLTTNSNSIFIVGDNQELCSENLDSLALDCYNNSPSLYFFEDIFLWDWKDLTVIYVILVDFDARIYFFFSLSDLMFVK